MGSVTYEGSIPEDDPRNTEGFEIKEPNKIIKDIGSAADKKLIDYLPESTREHELIGKWLNLMQKREKGLLPNTNEPANNMSGDPELDGTVATILLNTMQSRLPNYRWYDEEGNLKSVRDNNVLKQRKIQLLPIHLFTINWANSGPGIEWPESYSVTYVPSHNVRIVTTSSDSTDLYGNADLAIGWCRPYRNPEFGTKKVIQSWWRRLHEWIGHPWADFYSEGLVGADRAEKWALEVYGSRINYDFY